MGRSTDRATLQHTDTRVHPEPLSDEIQIKIGLVASFLISGLGFHNDVQLQEEMGKRSDGHALSSRLTMCCFTGVWMESGM